jgi:thiol-disulfide isomerase/thioredoxin
VDPAIAIGITFGIVLLAAVIGAIWKVTTGRRRAPNGETFEPGDLPGVDEFAPGATLVQFSTEYCATCPGTRRYLQQVAGERGGVTHIDIDLTYNPELAKALRILQTPTVFVLDPSGHLESRFGGAPRRDELNAVLDRLVPIPEWNL